MTAKKIPEIIKITARKLRENMTETERILWEYLRNRKLLNEKFLRQYPIYVYTENSGLDRFVIPDFVSKNKKIIIELDGNIHSIKEVYELDKYKEELLKNLGYKIIRFKNEEILNNLENSIKKIKYLISSLS